MGVSQADCWIIFYQISRAVDFTRLPLFQSLPVPTFSGSCFEAVTGAGLTAGIRADEDDYVANDTDDDDDDYDCEEDEDGEEEEDDDDDKLP